MFHIPAQFERALTDFQPPFCKLKLFILVMKSLKKITLFKIKIKKKKWPFKISPILWKHKNIFWKEIYSDYSLLAITSAFFPDLSI